MTDEIASKVVVITGEQRSWRSSGTIARQSECEGGARRASARPARRPGREITASGTEVEVCTVDMANAVDINEILFRPTVPEY